MCSADDEDEGGGASGLQTGADEGMGMAMVEVGDEEEKDSDIEDSPATALVHLFPLGGLF